MRPIKNYRCCIKKDLIRFTPQIQIMNESFSRYILLAAEREDLITLERTQSPNTWSRLKLPLLLGVGLLILFMFATQQEFKNSLLALISLLPVILPAFPELPSFLSAVNFGESSRSLNGLLLRVQTSAHRPLHQFFLPNGITCLMRTPNLPKWPPEKYSKNSTDRAIAILACVLK